MPSRTPVLDKRTANIAIAVNNNRYSDTMLTPPTELLYKDDIHKIIPYITLYSTHDISLFKGYTQDAINEFRRATSITVLNFASSIQAGGGYLTGMETQEEALCRNTPTLYPSYCALSKTIGGTTTSPNRPEIKHFQNGTHYWPAWRHKWNSCIMYTRKIENYQTALQSGNYNFDSNNGTFINVITASAPKLTGKDSDSVPQPHVTEYDDLLAAVCKLAIINSRGERATRDAPHVLILGAWGCGAYGNNPTTIAKSFSRVIDQIDWPSNFKIVFAIPAGNNFETFKGVFPMAVDAESQVTSPTASRPRSEPIRSNPVRHHVQDSKIPSASRPSAAPTTSIRTPGRCHRQDRKITYQYDNEQNVLTLTELGTGTRVFNGRVRTNELVASSRPSRLNSEIITCVNNAIRAFGGNAVYIYNHENKYHAAWKTYLHGAKRDAYFYAQLPSYSPRSRGGALTHGVYDKNKYVYKLLP